MSKKIETYRVGILGEEPLLNMEAAHKCYDKFREQFSWEPTQLRVSYGAFNHLRAMAERVTMVRADEFMGCEVKVDPDMEDDTWQFCKEDTKVLAL